MLWVDAALQHVAGTSYVYFCDLSGTSGRLPINSGFSWNPTLDKEENIRSTKGAILHIELPVRMPTGGITIVEQLKDNSFVSEGGFIYEPWDLIWPMTKHRCHECKGKKYIEMMNFYYPCSICLPHIKDKAMTAEEIR